ncbi:MAG: polysaccharide biosynthesis/export family protein, partial [Gemmatimonas sp.]
MKRVALPIVAALLSLGFRSASAQNLPTNIRPTPEQARELLKSRPDWVQQLQERYRQSGLSNAQVRARLKAEGYPEDLLDPYLSGNGEGTGATPSREVFSAIRALGITDSSDVDDLERLAQQRNMRREMQDNRRDTTVKRDTTLSEKSAEIFGLSLFQSANNRFQANTEGPVDPGYRLGPGDKLVLILTGDVERADELDVTREGFVVIPDVGQVNVANLTLGQLEDLLYTRLGRVYSGVRRGADATTRFTVSVSSLRSVQVFVTGDVVEPRAYRISCAATVMTALYAAGGP